MAGFYPSDKVASDFNGGQEWRDGIDGIAASDLNNIVELLLHLKTSSGGTKKLYRHDIELVSDYYGYLAYFYITLYNADSTNYSVENGEDEDGNPYPLTDEQVQFIPTNYIVCSGSWSDSMGTGAENIAQQIRRSGSNIDILGIGQDEYGANMVLDAIPIADFHRLVDTVTEIVL